MKINLVKMTHVAKSFELMTMSGYMKLMSAKASLLSVLVLILFCSTFIFVGCDKNELEIRDIAVAKHDSARNEIYPMDQYGTRSESNGYWESWNSITLGNGQKVNSPWNPTSVTSAVPHDILEDIKYNDGWDIIFPLPEDINETSYKSKSQYLIFHNRYTGILKGFCYMSESSFHPNNHGIWQISMNTPTALFAFHNNPITKMSEKEQKDYYVSNITSNATHGFSIGWNCFQIELAYDPSQSGWLTVSALSSNTVELSLEGNLKANTEGLITESEGKGNYKSGIAKIAGEEAGKWITSKINDKTILGVPTSIVSAGLKSIVSWGAGSIIGAFTGLFKSQNTTKSLQLTTNGTFTINGSAIFQSTSGITPIQINMDPSKIGYLGVWGLKDEPTLLFSPYAMLESSQEHTNGYTREYRLSIVNSGKKASITVNPKIYEIIDYVNSETNYYQSDKYTRRGVWGWSGSLGRDPINTKKIYDGLYSPNFYMIADVAFLGDENQYLTIDQYDAPFEIFIPNVPNGPKGAIPNFRYDSKFLASVGVILTLPNGSVSYSFHRCVPKIDWNFSEFDNGMYQYLYPCEPVTQIQSHNLHTKAVSKTDMNLNRISN